jgi:exopolysaccharide production protein ExoZ
MPVMTAAQIQAQTQTRANPVSGRKKLAHLQALRGLAAALVVLAHSTDSLAKRDLISPFLADRLGISGYFGVATFFIISGFIIFKTSAGAFGNNRASAVFILRRLIRIFPVYWITTAAFFILSPHRTEFAMRDVLCSVLLIPHEIGGAGDMHPLVGQGWTLQYEMLFYLIFTAGLVLTRRAGTVLILATLLALVAVGSTLMPLSSITEPLTLPLYWTRPILLLFAVGIGFGLLEPRLPRVTIPRPFALMLVVLAVWFAYSLTVPLSGAYQLQFPTVLVVWLLCAAWVGISIFGRSSPGWFEWMAERFGDASYSVYLFHTFILSVLLRLKVQDYSRLLFVIAALVGSNAFGYGVYCLVERPILRTLRDRLRFTSRRGSSVPRHLPAAPR